MCNNAGPSLAEMKFQPMALTGPGDTYTFNGKKRPFANRYVTVNGPFTLKVDNVVDGGQYQLIIIKNTPNDITVTLPADSFVSEAAAATMVLSGAAGSRFLTSFTHKP